MTGNLMLVFVAGFVFFAARGEAFMADRENIELRKSTMGLANPIDVLARESLSDARFVADRQFAMERQLGTGLVVRQVDRRVPGFQSRICHRRCPQE